MFEDWQASCNGVMMDLTATKYNDLTFWTGDSFDPNGMIAWAINKIVDGEERPVLLFFRHGLREKEL